MERDFRIEDVRDDPVEMLPKFGEKWRHVGNRFFVVLDGGFEILIEYLPQIIDRR